MPEFHREIVTVQVPVNALTRTGIDLIREFLSREGLPNSFPKDWDWVWKVNGKAVYVGTLPKRIAKYMYTQHAKKLTHDQLARLGDIGSANTEKTGEYHIRFWDQINWRDGDFGDSGSCIMSPNGCHSKARTILQSHGVNAVQFFNGPHADSGGFARAWCVPHPNVEGAFVIWNAYGIQLISVARILSHYWGMTYRVVDSLSNHGNCSSTVYVNSGKGYLIGDAGYINSFTAEQNITLQFGWSENVPPPPPPQETCPCCGVRVPINTMHTEPGRNRRICDACFNAKFMYCANCGEAHATTSCKGVLFDDENESLWCPNCVRRYADVCEHCGKHSNKDYTVTVEGKQLCRNCYSNREIVSYCDCCGKYLFAEHVGIVDSYNVCHQCIAKLPKCEECSKTVRYSDHLSLHEGKKVCRECLPKKKATVKRKAAVQAATAAEVEF